ncbi:uncharacterized protein DNG_08280 [Cephalotrichum gorgonifer]|uniref:Prolyl 4-hydroxylase alpha subunit domain-containing protein n=1 Tax=Cephalotrichum gorgonifer TaxID=2041049 RepID=A0AAE8SYC3_9PEZI|nr:uncharacterized protein DNG_08280 [Cephalotrichum gorgonifer]
MFIQTEYKSQHVPIPDSFLTTPPAKPVVATHIDWSSSPLPSNKGRTALVIDNVLSPEECVKLLELTEASVPREDGDTSSPWKPALVNVAVGFETHAPDYRNSERIIWDNQVIVDRIWERIAQADGVRALLETVPGAYIDEEWHFRRFNERMRFLKYSSGQFFKPHCDGPYGYEKDGAIFETKYTIQLYLNDSAAVDPTSELVGGATSFLGRNYEDRLDVNPKAGSVLLFQHYGLRHEGAKVEAGVKYTMRTDILYEFYKQEQV